MRCSLVLWELVDAWELLQFKQLLMWIPTSPRLVGAGTGKRRKEERAGVVRVEGEVASFAGWSPGLVKSKGILDEVLDFRLIHQ